ncbi:SDR family NAD(P)-dependent oxidoreductase [Microbacterium phosphatis]|uniref:SDR family NAD(P)-dependent oxidoreductase n=1 Tax=Microbacterium phosphatis TaxID=3140248 RepID=UPI00314084BD
MTWDPRNLPDLAGRTYAVTGATAGIGYFAAEQLADAGARVVLASRSSAKLDAARAAIRGQVPQAEVETVVVDLGSRASVARAADELSRIPALEGVFLNGGSMAMTRGAVTADGLPEMVGTHTVANFALVAGTLGRLVATARETGRDARIVHASTGFVKRWERQIADLREVPRSPLMAYTQAKTATEVFAHELDRRLRAADLPVRSILSHPGVGVDARTPQRPGVRDRTTPYQRNPFTPWAQGKDAAAWPGVRALVDPEAEGGDFFGPRNGIRGVPVRTEALARTAAPGAAADALWRQLEALAGVALPVPAGR